MKQTSLFANRGASLVEVFAAMAIVAVSALAAGSFFSHQISLTRNLTRNSSCRAALDSQLSYMREMTTLAPGFEWKGKSDGDTGFSVTPPTGVTGDKWVNDSVRFQHVTDTDIVAGAAGSTRVLNTERLQKGSVGLAAALYNGISGIESGVDMSSAISHVTGKALPADYDKENLKNFAVTISINTFNLGSGNLQGPAGKPWARPQGLVAGNPTDPTGQVIGTFATDSTTKLGYRVALRGTYEDATGASRTCDASEDFFYPIDLQGPKISVVLNAYDASTDAGSITPYGLTMDPTYIRARPECSHDSSAQAGAAVRLEIGFKSTVAEHEAIEPGTVFLCRDVSAQYNPNYCPGATNAQMNGENFSGIGSPWVPCQEATACGMRAAHANFHKDGPGQVRYVLEYNQSTKTSTDGLWGCDIQMDVATVDAAGNFSLLSSKAHPHIAGLSAVGGRYFQPAPCYACYKKKPFSFLTLALLIGGGLLTAGAGLGIAATALAAVGAGAAAGGIIACAAGIGGACHVGGYNFKHNACNVVSPYQLNTGKYMCRKLTPRYPPWYRAGISSGHCNDLTGTWPGRTETYTLQAADEGQTGNDSLYDLPNGVSCVATAVCSGGTWVQSDPSEPIAQCNNLKTAVQVDASFQNPTRLCIVEVPQGSTAFMPDSHYYDTFTSTCYDYGYALPCHQHWPVENSVCVANDCHENHSGMCNRTNNNYSYHCNEYPLDPFNGSTNGTHSPQHVTGPPYYYFDPYNNATDGNLTNCEIAD